MGRLILCLVSGGVVLVLTAVMVIALGAPGSQAHEPKPDVTNPPTPSPTATGLGPVPPAVNGVGGIVELLTTDDGTATASETDGGTVYVVALVGVIGAILIAGGWYAGRRLLP